MLRILSSRTPAFSSSLRQGMLVRSLCASAAQQKPTGESSIQMRDSIELVYEPKVDGQAAHAAEDLNATQVIGRIDLTQNIVDKADRFSIQISETTHIKGSALQECVYLNHSCAPTCKVHFHNDTLDFVTLQPIKKGEALTFNYVTSEWDMATPFDCTCGAPGCVGHVAGFKHLKPKQQAALYRDGLLSPFVANKYDTQQQK
ncbi:hypothetical protein SARC_06586 [Sphaeroforma arctica JP610]|uniref:Post-SET domain-containing protein n=1 Tax=Sphaeroforma arctica JP610 TaxID=667725 RepID=A0A0L0FYR5_9EUKA|nr:hypothetical protein SARC_06586 [Sphaeroforma arctica JP610]KNC81083.1 hypothetical protein SARC_06586 [Sphaeroforma arctica JP610]|eukprot:XP_014154985.1 hypothetical protein SARC_06586 [Sphaeroforma arctica JP610]